MCERSPLAGVEGDCDGLVERSQHVEGVKILKKKQVTGSKKAVCWNSQGNGRRRYDLRSNASLETNSLLVPPLPLVETDPMASTLDVVPRGNLVAPPFPPSTCKNSGNPYHVCSDFFLLQSRQANPSPSISKSWATGEEFVAPTSNPSKFSACKNSSNPFHECTSFCLEWIKRSNPYAVPPSSPPVAPVSPAEKLASNGSPLTLGDTEVAFSYDPLDFCILDDCVDAIAQEVGNRSLVLRCLHRHLSVDSIFEWAKSTWNNLVPP